MAGIGAGVVVIAVAVGITLAVAGEQRRLEPGDWRHAAAEALSAAGLAPHRVEAVVLLASVGPGCVNRWDRRLAAPLAGPLCELVAWRLTPWIARARLAQIGWWRGGPPRPDEHVNWQV